MTDHSEFNELKAKGWKVAYIATEEYSPDVEVVTLHRDRPKLVPIQVNFSGGVPFEPDIEEQLTEAFERKIEESKG